jgi:hypothetical protein
MIRNCVNGSSVSISFPAELWTTLVFFALSQLIITPVSKGTERLTDEVRIYNKTSLWRLTK